MTMGNRKNGAQGQDLFDLRQQLTRTGLFRTSAQLSMGNVNVGVLTTNALKQDSGKSKEEVSNMNKKDSPKHVGSLLETKKKHYPQSITCKI